MKLVAWVAQNIRVDNDCNLGGAPISPEGVWKARVADAHSRDIFFVSMARSMAIPARINGVTGKVQLIGDDGAMDVDLNHHPEEPVCAGATSRLWRIESSSRANLMGLPPRYGLVHTVSPKRAADFIVISARVPGLF